jgi:hypothetical protein
LSGELVRQGIRVPWLAHMLWCFLFSPMQALLSPSTGIIDSHQFMLSCLGDAEDHGASIAYESPVTRARVITAHAPPTPHVITLTSTILPRRITCVLHSPSLFVYSTGSLLVHHPRLPYMAEETRCLL